MVCLSPIAGLIHRTVSENTLIHILGLSTALRSFEDSWDNSYLWHCQDPRPYTPSHQLHIAPWRGVPPCPPSHPPIHMPSHVAATTTAISATHIAAVTAGSEVPHVNPFSPWDGDNAPPEILEAQECLAGPWRRVHVVSAIGAWGGKGEVAVMGIKGRTEHCTVLVMIIMVLF